MLGFFRVYFRCQGLTRVGGDGSDHLTNNARHLAQVCPKMGEHTAQTTTKEPTWRTIRQ